jgi:hypothetical protein
MSNARNREITTIPNREKAITEKPFLPNFPKAYQLRY